MVAREFDFYGALSDLPTREAGLVISVAIWAAVVATWLLARRDAGYPLRVTFVMLILFSTLRLYSASSFVWGPMVPSDEVWGVLRATVLAVQTIIVVLALGLLAYAVRRRRMVRYRRPDNTRSI